ncbi:hypothetical protein HHI36_005833 [Cryptolaemus montrouzieri]|uniref:Uncharacterized protein n=1 Tax=Cryptolaemus montrouzieri TaxID=559131 RepID=A0ABD2NVA4_9CUCU
MAFSTDNFVELTTQESKDNNIPPAASLVSLEKAREKAKKVTGGSTEHCQLLGNSTRQDMSKSSNNDSNSRQPPNQKENDGDWLTVKTKTESKPRSNKCKKNNRWGRTGSSQNETVKATQKKIYLSGSRLAPDTKSYDLAAMIRVNIPKAKYHEAQMLSMEWPRRTFDFTSELCRPVTKKGLNISHSILGGLSWEFIRDPNIQVNDAFNAFHQNFDDSCLIACPERKVGNFSSYPKVDWYTKELRDIKNRLDLINKLHDRY